jgi:hypothetical protein
VGRSNGDPGAGVTDILFIQPEIPVSKKTASVVMGGAGN